MQTILLFTLPLRNRNISEEILEYSIKSDFLPYHYGIETRVYKGLSAVLQKLFTLPLRNRNSLVVFCKFMHKCFLPYHYGIETQC